MKKILDILTGNKYAIIWTVCYIAVMWAILQFMFNFNIFDIQNWNILMHSRLRGFPGFVFGILVLSAIPMYIATTIIILRTKKPLFTIPVPKFMEPVPEENAPSTQNAEENQSEVKKEAEAEESEPQKIIPTELRAAFVRARSHIGPAPKSNFDISNITKEMHPALQTEQHPELQQAGELPLPNDFDITTTDTDDQFQEVPSFTPVFSDIDFDSEDTVQIPTEEIESTATNISNDLAPVIDYLISNGKEFSVEGNVITTQQDVIAAHNETDFWIADEKTWFASGKQKPSPVDALINKSKETGLHPILYLGATNILDLETNKKDWEDSGIEVITELNDLK